MLEPHVWRAGRLQCGSCLLHHLEHRQLPMRFRQDTWTPLIPPWPVIPQSLIIHFTQVIMTLFYSQWWRESAYCIICVCVLACESVCLWSSLFERTQPSFAPTHHCSFIYLFIYFSLKSSRLLIQPLVSYFSRLLLQPLVSTVPPWSSICSLTKTSTFPAL